MAQDTKTYEKKATTTAHIIARFIKEFQALFLRHLNLV